MAGALQLLPAGDQTTVHPVVAVTLLRTLVDAAEQDADWKHVLDYIDGLPQGIGQTVEFRQQRALAISAIGQVTEAVGSLEELIRTAGPSPERLGLLGGRYKRLMKSASDRSERLRYLSKAIDSYEQGMTLDLNEYYCASNLPRLYRERGRKGDEERALSTLHLVMAACDRARHRGVLDEWLRQTLLGAAFDAADADKAEELLPDIAVEGAALWKLQSTLADLEHSATQVKDDERRNRLLAVLNELRAIATH
jgi:hypothetical protein